MGDVLMDQFVVGVPIQLGQTLRATYEGASKFFFFALPKLTSKTLSNLSSPLGWPAFANHVCRIFRS